MELEKLEKYKTKYKDLTERIGSLQSYLSKVARERHDVAVITPYAISSQLHIPEADAIFLLSLAAHENLLHKKFQVWADEDNLLGDYEDPSQIPAIIRNNASGKDIDRDHYYVDIVFELDK